MRITTSIKQRAEASSLSRTGSMILKGQTLDVSWIPDGSHDLGFTSGREKRVYIAWEHEYMKELSDIEKTMLRMGIFAHELLHQVLTNFDYTNAIISRMTNIEASIFMNFANTLEDPAIEYFAPKIFGGRLLDSLRFSIQHIYKLSPCIDESKTAFAQLINALVQFGDMGLVKGEFTFPEAYEYFCKLAPLYNEGIECPDNKRRIDIAKECMEISRPLWEKEAKEQADFEKKMQELLKSLSSAMQDAGLSLDDLEDLLESLSDTDSSNSDGDKENSSNESNNEDSEKEDTAKSRRKKFVAALKEDANSSEGNENDKSSNSGKSDSENEKNSDEEKPFSGSSCADMNENKEDESSADDVNDSNSNSPAEDESSNSGNDSNSEEESNSNQENNNNSVSKGNSKVNPSSIAKNAQKCNEIASEEYFIDEKAIENIERELKREIEREIKEQEQSNPDFDVPNFNIESSLFKSAKCLNRQIKASSSIINTYRSFLTEVNGEISSLTNSLKRLFQQDETEYLRYTSGRYNIKRGAFQTSAKMFDKRKDNGRIDDIIVEILVDESGSMSDGKIDQARKTCIIISEACAKLNIPCSVIGFYSGKEGYDALHDHYVSWKNTALERASLISMRAHGCNFDGYSIRYAGEIIKKKNAEHKILFVISDGQPACYVYDAATGIIDTSNAIKEVRKYATVFGIAVGRDCGPKVLQEMYGKDFIHVSDSRDLPTTLANKLKAVVKSYKY